MKLQKLDGLCTAKVHHLLFLVSSGKNPLLFNHRLFWFWFVFFSELKPYLYEPLTKSWFQHSLYRWPIYISRHFEKDRHVNETVSKVQSKRVFIKEALKIAKYACRCTAITCTAKCSSCQIWKLFILKLVSKKSVLPTGLVLRVLSYTVHELILNDEQARSI